MGFRTVNSSCARWWALNRLNVDWKKCDKNRRGRWKCQHKIMKDFNESSPNHIIRDKTFYVSLKLNVMPSSESWSCPFQADFHAGMPWTCKALLGKPWCAKPSNRKTLDLAPGWMAGAMCVPHQSKTARVWHGQTSIQHQHLPTRNVYLFVIF